MKENRKWTTLLQNIETFVKVELEHDKRLSVIKHQDLIRLILEKLKSSRCLFTNIAFLANNK